MSSENIKGNCSDCGGKIGFPPEAMGQIIACPHCGQQTKLLDPNVTTKCPCTHCGGNLKFPLSADGATIECPHCGNQTLLTAPADAFPSPAPAPAPTPAPAGMPPPPPAAQRSPATAQKAPPAPAPARGGQRKKAPYIAQPVSKPSGKRPKMPKAAAARGSDDSGNGKKVAIIFAACLGGLLLIAGGGFAAMKFMKKGPGAAKRPDYDLQLIESKIQKAPDGGLVYVVGSVTNHADYQYFNVRVEFDLKDASGNAVGTASDYLPNLAPNARWDFQALVLEETVTEAVPKSPQPVVGEADKETTGGSGSGEGTDTTNQ